MKREFLVDDSDGESGGSSFLAGIKYTFKKKILPNYILYLFLLPALAYLIIFHYWPIYGAQIAFKDFKPGLGIIGSPWVGLKHFERFLTSYMFVTLIKNTLTISLYQIFAGLPFSILLAISLQYSFSKTFKKFAQTATYAPHFISQVVMVGIMLIFLSPQNGIINIIIKNLGGDPVFFMGNPDLFKHIYVWSGVWQGVGWGSIIFLAVLTNVNPELHEAAKIDGANKLQRVWNIDIPVIMPTAIILLIMDMGKALSIGFEKIYLMQNDTNVMVSEVISTYTYKLGILNAEYSYTAAIGLFNNIINLTLLLIVNKLAKRFTDHSLF